MKPSATTLSCETSYSRNELPYIRYDYIRHLKTEARRKMADCLYAQLSKCKAERTVKITEKNLVLPSTGKHPRHVFAIKAVITPELP